MLPQPLIRVTRSRSRQTTIKVELPNVSQNSQAIGLRVKPAVELNIAFLPEIRQFKPRDASEDELKLMRLKQQKLREPHGQIPAFLTGDDGSSSGDEQFLYKAVAATLVFGQETAGTAVCISSSGLLLTCSHCVAESASDLDMSKAHWLLFADGRIVKAKCVAWDERRDLALLQVVATEDLTGLDIPTFPIAELAGSPPKRDLLLLCVGHPGSEDMEADRSGVLTDYDVLHLSRGRFRGLAKGQEVQNNSDIGALQHDCWTYWGHSGAPLLGEDGKLVGLHSSWDDETGMRRGVAWEAVKAFLAEHTVVG